MAMAKYLISFPSKAMVVPDGDWDAVVHDAHAVIDEDSLPDGCSRMDLNTSDTSPDLAEQPRGQLEGQARTPETMTKPMQGQSLKTRIAEQDFKQSTSSGVSHVHEGRLGSAPALRSSATTSILPDPAA